MLTDKQRQFLSELEAVVSKNALTKAVRPDELCALLVMNLSHCIAAFKFAAFVKDEDVDKWLDGICGGLKDAIKKDIKKLEPAANQYEDAVLNSAKKIH